MKNKKIKVEKVSKLEVETMSVEKILEEAKTINTEKVAEEVLTWLCNNVAYFIDNQKKAFKLDLIIDSEDMAETKKLQNLYRSIPEETVDLENKEEDLIAIQNCREELDKITKITFDNMKRNKSLLEELFKRMSYFYEMVGVYNGKQIIKELSGAVEITEFEYEAFSMGVKVSAPSYLIQNSDGDKKVVEGQSKDYVIPEAFTIWLEISLNDTKKQNSLF